MVAINFDTRFANAVADGSKTQTIRPPRKRPFKVGDTLQLYVHQRNPKCHKLRNDVKCTEVYDVMITSTDVRMNGIWMNKPALYRLFQRDGFESWEEFRDWFDKWYGLPFTGVVVRWEIKW